MELFKLNFIVSYAFTGVTLLFLAFFVYIKNSGRFMNRIFALYSLSISWWALFSIPMLLASGPAQATFWDRICLMGTVFIPSTFMHFNYTFLKINREKKIAIRICYLLSSLFFVSLFTPFFIQGTELKTVGVYFSKPSSLYAIFVAYFFSASIYGIFCLYRAARTTAAHTFFRRQVYFLFWATLLGYTGGGFNYNLVFNIPPYGIIPYGNYAIGIYVILVAYAIIRHRLMDIEVIIKKTLVFTGLFLVSYGVFATFIVLSQEIFKDITGVSKWASVIPSIFVVVLILRPLENALKGITDKVLFQKRYDYRHLLRTFSNEVLTVLDLDMLVNLTVSKLVDIVKLENAAIILYDEDEEVFSVAASEGVDITGVEIASGDRIVDALKSEGKYIRLKNGVSQDGIKGAEKEIIRGLDSAAILPLSHRNEIVGMLSLGKKKSDEEFTEDELDILEPLARTLSVAIVNAQLFEKLSEAQAQAAQREKMAVIGTLSAGINHEICNPLGVARGQCEMFLLNYKEGVYDDKGPDELLEKARTIMEKVINETDRATAITRKLSSFAKPSRDRLTDDVDVRKEIEEVISLVEYDLKLDDIEVEQDVELELPCIAADRKQVQEIFFNIMRNAAQAMEGSGKITMRATSAGKNVFIDIEDSGKGISTGNLGRIFDPFFTTKEPGRGTGLGLFIVKQIVERNGGKISVKSEQGEGTVVSLVFPVASGERMKVE